jgi:iron-sulfur cluster repair protein YtfE (RIC family)
VRVGSLSRPLLMEFVEHDTIHEWLVKVRELGLRLRIRGADAALLERIDDLDRSVHRHLHSENNVLIPRVVDLEHRLRSRRLASAAQHPTSA